MILNIEIGKEWKIEWKINKIYQIKLEIDWK